MKGAYSRKLTDEQIDEVVMRYRRGETIEQIAIDFDCSSAPIRNALILRGIERRRTPGRGPSRLNFNMQKVRA
jgi:helix-turn-helix resolvase-like protein